MKTARRLILIAPLLAGLVIWFALWQLEKHYEKQYAGIEHYTQIEDGLYLGGNLTEPPPGTQAVLNLCEHDDPYWCDVYLWKPIRDSTPAPKIEWLAEQVDFVEKQRNERRITYVHCFAGVSRSGMVVTAYLMREHGWTRDEALAKIREKRPQVRPNRAFMELLAKWEVRLRG
ncbi:MAG: dual specificity protein phosphatase family protein [Planctomycetes bacterium]|nr:dual specificity protein phosphatase family protein [Planctomycetota bacterium]